MPRATLLLAAAAVLLLSGGPRARAQQSLEDVCDCARVSKVTSSFCTCGEPTPQNGHNGCCNVGKGGCALACLPLAAVDPGAPGGMMAAAAALAELAAAVPAWLADDKLLGSPDPPVCVSAKTGAGAVPADVAACAAVSALADAVACDAVRKAPDPARVAAVQEAACRYGGLSAVVRPDSKLAKKPYGGGQPGALAAGGRRLKLEAKMLGLAALAGAFAGHAREAARREEAPPGAGLGWTPPPEGSEEATADAAARHKAAEAAAERAVEELEAAKAAEAAARVAEARKKEADRRAMEAAAGGQTYCEAFESCGDCRVHERCAWCIGERTCVTEGPWMCQGDEDTIHSKAHYPTRR
jgi:hypothetical protein